MNIMPYYFSQTDNNASVIELRQQTTSGVSYEEVKSYEFNKTPIKFTDTKGGDDNEISEQSEKNFYKKAFETKGP